jgi:hypothetical protein
LAATLLVREHIQQVMFHRRPTLLEHSLVLEHTRLTIFLLHNTSPVVLLVREHILPTILVQEPIPAHMEIVLPVLDLTWVIILVAERILVPILVHMRAIQF